MKKLSAPLFCLLSTLCCFAQSGTFEQVSGSLAQISVGADGAVWGLDSSQNIFTWDSSTSQLVQIPGALAQIAVGNANAVWGLNSGGYIYRWDSSKQNWTPIPGNLMQIAVGADGDVWGLNSGMQVWHYDQQAQTWTYVDTSQLSVFTYPVVQLAVGNTGSVYALVEPTYGFDSPFWFNPGTGRFQEVAGGGFSGFSASIGSLAVGADGDLWSGNLVAHFNPSQGAWNTTSSSDGVTHVFVGSATNVWGIANYQGLNGKFSDGPVDQWDIQSGSWVSTGIMLSQIAAGADGSVWGVDTQNRVFHYTGPTQPSNTLRPIPGSFQKIAVGADGTAWAVDANNLIYGFDRQTQRFQIVPGELAQVSVGFAGYVWGVNAAGQIWVRDQNGPDSWTNIAGELTQIAAAPSGSVFGINAQDQTYRYDFTGWRNSVPPFFSLTGWINIPGALMQLSTGVDGTTWGINQQQQIYKYDSNTNSWAPVPGALVQISVGDANNVWGVNADQQVYRYDATIPGWVQIRDALLTQVAVAFDGAVWGVNAQGSLYQWDSATQTFAFVANGVTNVAVGNDSAVFAWNTNTGATYWYF